MRVRLAAAAMAFWACGARAADLPVVVSGFGGSDFTIKASDVQQTGRLGQAAGPASARLILDVGKRDVVSVTAAFMRKGIVFSACKKVDVTMGGGQPSCLPSFTQTVRHDADGIYVCETRCDGKGGGKAGVDDGLVPPSAPPTTDKAAAEAHGSATGEVSSVNDAQAASMLQGHGIRDTKRIKLGSISALGMNGPTGGGTGGGAGSGGGGGHGGGPQQSPMPQKEPDGPVTDAQLNMDGKAMLGGTPQDFRSAEANSVASVAQAASRWRLGDFKGVVDETNKALAFNPNNADALRIQAQAYEKMGDFADAEADLKRAVTVSTTDAKSWEHLAWAQLKQKKPDEALASARQALALENDADALAFKAFAEEMLGRKEDAVNDITEAAKLDRRFSAAAEAAARGENMWDSIEGGSSAGGSRRGRLPPWLPWAAGAAGLGLTLSVLAAVALRRFAPAPPPPAEAPAPELPIGGKYRLNSGRGPGAAGEVRAAVDVTLNRPAAVKTLAPDVKAVAPAALETLLREARAAAAVRHPNLVEIYDVIEESPAVYLVAEALRGRTVLALLLERKRLDLAEAAALLKPVCEALEVAHGQGLVHRDIKPASIMLTEGGGVKLMGFGWTTAAAPSVYRAPEAQFGQLRKEADVYALASCFYEMLTGRPPFPPGTTLTDRMEKRYPAASSLVANLPPSLDGLFSAALEPDPIKRLPSAAELLKGLDAALAARS
jgi:serine/threonine-protein kinase